MNLLTTKAIVAVTLGGLSVIIGIVPIICSRRVKRASSGPGAKIVSCMNCFGAGVILTTSLANMLPEVNVFVQNNYENKLLTDTGLPLAEIFAIAGFFVIFIIEEITHWLISWCTEKRNPRGKNLDREEHDRMLHHIGHHNHHGQHHHTYTHQDQQNHRGHHHQDHAFPIIDDSNSLKATFNGFLMVLAISLHELIEGVAVGLAATQKSVWLYFMAISSHKYIISFCISLQLVTTGVKPLISVLYISVFSFVSTIGTFIGVALSETGSSEEEAQTVTVTVLQGIATGSLLYVAFLEILEKERQQGTSGLIQISCLILGFLCMFGLMFIELGVEPASDSHEQLHESLQFNASTTKRDLLNYRNEMVKVLDHLCDPACLDATANYTGDIWRQIEQLIEKCCQA